MDTDGMAIEGDAVVRLFADGHAAAGFASFLAPRRKQT
jgi:prepilin-type processing-associated H-X9-DG protein